MSAGQTAGTYKLVLADVVFTATGGVIGPHRYAILYNDSSTNKKLLGWWDYGTSITTNAGDTYTVDFDPATGAMTVA